MKLFYKLAAVIFIFFLVAALFLKKVELLNPLGKTTRIAIQGVSLTGYGDNNNSLFLLKAKTGTAERNMDYVKMEGVSCVLKRNPDSNITVSGNRAVFSLHNILFTDGVSVNIASDLSVFSNSINFNNNRNELSFYKETLVSLKNHGELLFKTGKMNISKNVLSLEKISLSKNNLSIKSTSARLNTKTNLIEFSKNIKASFTNSENKTILISTDSILFQTDKDDFSIKGNVVVKLEEKTAYSQKGYYSHKNKTLTLLDKAYLIENNKKLSAEKIRIQTDTFSLEAFENVEAIIPIKD